MRTCNGCPYKDFMYFRDYYGVDDYAHVWITSAFEGKDTGFTNGNENFALYEIDEGRKQAIVKGTAFMAVFMAVIRELNDALVDCRTNKGTVKFWDEAVVSPWQLSNNSSLATLVSCCD